MAQDRCASIMNLESIKQADPKFYTRIINIEEHLKQYLAQLDEGAARNGPSIIRIPVVVHVLHNGSPVGTGLNIGMAQVESQIEVLNEDFRRLNVDAANTPGTFLPVAADSQIEFYLACIDPNDNPTNGVVRIQGEGEYSVEMDGDQVDETLTGIKVGINGSQAWPTNRYLNIWVANLADDVLGYAQFPDQYASKPNTDGVVINTSSFGTIGFVQAPFDQGRTATHEVGHWLNLLHIWGDELCGDDLVGDTPVQEWSSPGCPNHPRASCGSDDMFMKYMDYTDDACMNMFTQGQRNRMRAVLSPGGVRHSFISSPLGMSVTGSDRICTTNTNFTLQNVPAGQTVTWAVSPTYLFPSTGRTGTGITAALRAAGTSVSGAATLTYTVDTDCGEYQVSREIWVGVPNTSMQVDAPYYPICLNEYTYINAFYDPYNTNPEGNKDADITNFIWQQPAGVSCFTAGTRNEVLACWFTTPNMYNIRVRAVNSCGQGAFQNVYFNVYGCSYYSMSINPNPANGRVSIALTETPLDESAKAILQSENKGSREYQEYSFDSPPQRIRVFDLTGAERICVEDPPSANSYELDISHLRPGVYVLHLDHRNGTVTRQLRVE